MRVHITFSKTGALRYTGHLDLQSLWERAVRRADLPLAYSQAFHPQPKIFFASALPLGFSSRCEIVDLRFIRDVDVADLPGRLQAVMPSGIRVHAAAVIDDKAPALQTQLISAEYEVTLIAQGSTDSPPLSQQKLKQITEDILAVSTLLRERRGKKYDLRPLIEELTVISENRILMRLSARPGATGRPEEVLAEMGIEIENTRIERVGLIFQG